MNKYLKILMLSGGLVGAIAPTAINMDKTKSYDDLGTIYEQVEKMQETLPRLSRINYKLNIDLDENIDSYKNETTDLNALQDETIENNTNTDNNTATVETINTETDNTENMANNTLSNNEIANNDNNSSNNKNVDNANNENIANNSVITFTTTDNDGNETTLTKEETLTYLSETLNQTNIEYEQLKSTLSQAIKDTMDYLDAYKNGETTLTNEQKIYIKEHTNSIKFLAETLEDLSEDVLCCIDGCDNCDEEDEFEVTTSQYLSTINNLEERINALNNAIASLQFVNNIGNPFFFHNYAYRHNDSAIQDSETEINDTNNDNINDEKTDTNDTENNILEVDDENGDNTGENTTLSVENTQSTQDDKVIENNNSNTADDKPTTFGLKSNVDTYAPTKRNIDTFFNTALYNNEYMNGNAYGYGTPYGYGGGYGYGMPYGAGYGNPYGGMGLNSNIVNREVLEPQNENHETYNANANIEQQTQTEDTKQPKKRHTKRAKNIDTYTGTTIQSNINTMGESKISRFFKEKFNNLRNKVRQQKQAPSPIQNNDENNQPTDIAEQNILNPNENTTENVINDTETKETQTNTSPSLNIDKTDTLEQQKDIKAKQ